MGTTLPCLGRHWRKKSKQNEGQHPGWAHRHLASRQRPEVNSQKPCAEGEHQLTQIVLLYLCRDEPPTLGWTLLHQLASQKMPTDKATSQSDGGNSSDVVPSSCQADNQSYDSFDEIPVNREKGGRRAKMEVREG